MKSITTVFMCLSLLVGSVVVIFGNTTESTIGTNQLEGSMNSVQDHLTKARNLDQEIERMTEKVSEMKKEVDIYNQKPYLDTKGIRRNGLKILIGTTLKKISSMREQVAWHREEASKLASRDNYSEEMEGNYDYTSTRFGNRFESHSRNGNS